MTLFNCETSLALVAHVNDGPRCERKNAAHAFRSRSIPGQFQVALVTPGFTPAILYQPVILAIFGCAVTHRKHTVVHIHTAIVAVENSRLIKLESGLWIKT